jgi:putative transposase
MNREIITALEEARVLIEQWRREYNQTRPYSALEYRPPAHNGIPAEVKQKSYHFQGFRAIALTL